MGGQTSTQVLCKQEWDKYQEEVGTIKDGWTLVIDDSRNLDVMQTMSSYLAHATDLMENLMLGCKEVISESVHQELVDTIVKRLESVIEFDYKNYNDKVFNGVITLFRATDDYVKERKTEMVFVTILRFTSSTSRNLASKNDKQRTQDLDVNQIHIESSIKLQVRSIKDPELANTPSTEENKPKIGELTK